MTNSWFKAPALVTRKDTCPGGTVAGLMTMRIIPIMPIGALDSRFLARPYHAAGTHHPPRPPHHAAGTHHAVHIGEGYVDNGAR